MKKKKYLFLVLALLLLVTGTIFTYSIYRKSFSGNGTVTTSKWSVKVYKNTSTTPTANLNFTGSDISWTKHNGENGKIAPGDSGTINYTIDASGSQVDVAYTAEIGTITGPEGLTATVNPSSGTINYATGAGNMTQALTITVTWSGDINDDGDKDSNDMTNNNTTITIPVTLTVKENIPVIARGQYLVSESINTIGQEVEDPPTPTGVGFRNNPEAAMADWTYITGEPNDYKPYFLKHTYNGNIITESYLGFKINNTIYYLKGDDPSEYSNNAKIIFDAFGQNEEFCSYENPYDPSFDSNYFQCSIDNYLVSASNIGQTAAYNDSNYSCYIDEDGDSYCRNMG